MINNTHLPLITIVTPSYNQGRFLEEAIQSVLNQDYPNIEYLVIDGGSTDNTMNVLAKYCNHDIKYISEPDDGIYDAMNKGIALAKGQIIGILNADDMYYSSGVIALVASVMSDDCIDSCYGDLLYVKRNNIDKIVRYWRSSQSNKFDFYQGWIPPHPTFFVKKQIYEKYGFFRTDLGQAADYELMLRLLLCDSILASYIPTVLVKMRTGGITNASFHSRIDNHRSALLAWEVNGLKPKPWTLYFRAMRKFVQYLLPILRHNIAKQQLMPQ